MSRNLNESEERSEIQNVKRKAKGASPRRVTYGHALRNALLPVVTVIGTNFGFALVGSIVLE